jgi:hypothetical protein
MAEPKVIEPIVEPVVTPPSVEETPPVVEAAPSKTDLLRELSKEYDINLFDAEGIKKFKEYQESQKTDIQKKQDELDIYKTKETDWQTEKNGYVAKLKASELGIAPDKLEDALKLAGGNPDNLTEVLKKYPIFKSTDGIKIGIQDKTGTTPPNVGDETAAYMAANSNIYGKK